MQRDFGIYKPIDVSKVKLEQFRPEMLEIARRNATLDGKLYALPYRVGHRWAGRQHASAHESPTTPICAARNLKGKHLVAPAPAHR